MKLLRSLTARLLIVLAMSGAMLAMTGSPALAGDAGRNCTTFYAQNKPATGWGFTVCVKLVHDPAAHQWWATASVTSRTPGITLILYTIDMRHNTGFLSLDQSTVTGDRTTSVTGRTGKFTCSGTKTFTTSASGSAVWPNGVTSGGGRVDTDPPSVTGTC